MNNKVEVVTNNTRVAAIQCLYSVIFMGEELNSKLMRYFKTKDFSEDKSGVDINSKLFNFLIKGVIKNRDVIDELVLRYVDPDSLKNDELVFCILRLGVFEIMFRDKTPEQVVISEYTKIANSFYHSSKAGMVNAVLDKIYKNKVVD